MYIVNDSEDTTYNYVANPRSLVHLLASFQGRPTSSSMQKRRGKAWEKESCA